MWELCNMRYKAFKGITDGDTTRAGLFALLSAKGANFSGFDFWNDLTAAFLDHYLNHELRSALLQGQIARGITYDFDTKKYSVNDNLDTSELIGYLMGKFTETQAEFSVMSQENLNIVSFNDIDQNVYGAKSTTRNYGKVTIDITNGQKQLTDIFGAVDESDIYAQLQDTHVHGAQETTNVIANRTNQDGGGTDTTTRAVMGFNSDQFSDSEKSTNVIASRSNTIGGGTDTSTLATYTDTDTRGQHTDRHTEQSRTDMHTDAQSTDKHETAARTDSEGIATYTDTLTHTRHIVLTPDKYFEIQKEMADYNLYKSVLDAVRESVTKGVW